MPEHSALEAQKTAPQAGRPFTRKRKSRYRRWLAAGLLLLCLLLLYIFIPRKADLRTFDPAVAARLETQAWRHYYEKNYLRLGTSLYILCREQTGAAPARSAQIVWHAARAAKIFQRSTNRQEAMLALPSTEKYYRAIARASGEPFDINQAAQFEVEWWQQRREKVPPEVYAQTIADSVAAVYSTRNADIEQAAQLRAQAMAYRDARRNGEMTPADWQHIEQILRQTYQHLLHGLTTS